MIDTTQLITILIRLSAAAVLSGVIGVERDIRGHSAGLRTNILICLGAASFMLLSEFLAKTGPYDVSRMGAQVISGIGFLGGGAIIKHQYSVKGLTTAATIWISAAIGLTCGSGNFLLAASLTAIALFSLTVLEYLEHKYSHDFYRHCAIETASTTPMSKVRSLFQIQGVTLLSHDTKINYETKRQVVSCKLRIRDRNEEKDILSIIEEKIKSEDVHVYSISFTQ